MAQSIRSNKTKPLVGVTGNTKWFSPSWWCIRFAVFLAGGTATRISINQAVEPNLLDAIVISGGDDIHPSLYDGEEAANQEYDQARDKLETKYIQYAIAHNLPMLGICRGYQLINVLCGGNLLADIRPLRQYTSNRGTVLAQKTVSLQANSYLAKQMNLSVNSSNISADHSHISVKVNSLHHQAVDKVANGFNQVAKDKDGFIQAIESQNLAIIGVQWHPEYLWYVTHHRNLFVWLVNQAKSTDLKTDSLA